MPDKEVALVTGASSGLGVHFAHLLAARGWDLIVTARRTDRLEALRDQLQQQHGVSVRTIGQDLAEPDAGKQLFGKALAEGETVRVLINNAGVGHYGPVVDQSVENIDAMIQLNLSSLTTLTRLFAQGMKSAGGGYILQNASFSGFVPMPRYAIYAATKSYVVSMAQAMRYELRKSGVHISVLCPGFADSEFFSAAGHQPTKLMRMMTLDPRKVAQSGINGLFRRRAVIVPGAIYKMYAMLLRMLPRFAACSLAAGLIKNRTQPT